MNAVVIPIHCILSSFFGGSAQTGMQNRIILISLIVALWIGLKVIDGLARGPELLVMLSCIVTFMMIHSIWLLAAQSKQKRKLRKLSRQAITSENTGVAPVQAAWNPSVEIFVPAKNEARVIETTVRNLFKIDYEKLQVCVIDDCSTDDMPLVLERLKSEFPGLKVLRRSFGSCPGKSAALNDALPLSKAEVIAVFDADAYVAPDFLARTLPVLEPEGVGAVQAQKRIYEHQKTGALEEAQDSEYALDTYFQTSRDLIGGTVELRGNGELIKREALIDVGGWNNKSLTDDLDLSMRLLVNKWDISFCPEAEVWEEAVPKLKGLLRQRRRWAEGSIRRYLDYIFPLNSPTRLSLIERIDLLIFTVYFLVPALMLLEVTSDVMRFATGLPTNGCFTILIGTAIFLITQFNMILAMRTYRKPMPMFKTVWHSFAVVAYIYLHWCPCIIVSFCQILFGKSTYTWHRTEHVGRQV